MVDKNMRKVSSDEILTMIYYEVLDLKLKLDLLDRKVESLQQDISRSTFVRSEHLNLRYDHKSNELYITEFFKIAFEGNEAALLRRLFKKTSGSPKKSTKYYPAELADTFNKDTDGLKTAAAVTGTIKRIDATIKHRTMGLEVFKITTKVFYFL